MKNVISIIKKDFQKLFANAISIVVLIGLISIPSMYVWFNVAGTWDPYNNTGELEVAVCNQDQGYKNEYFPMEIEIGSSVVNSLRGNNAFKWVFVDKNVALDGINEGKYYAVIEIPEDFSKEIMSIFSDNTEPANLIYYSNEKLNVIAPKLTDKGADGIQQQINKTFSETITDVVLNLTASLINETNTNTAKELANKLSNSLDSITYAVDSTTSQIKSLKSMIQTLDAMIETTNNILPSGESAKSQEFRRILDETTYKLTEAKNTLDKVANYLESLGYSAQEIRDISTLIDDVSKTTSGTSTIIVDANASSASLKETLTSLQQLDNTLNLELDKIISQFNVISSDIKTTKDSLDMLSSNVTIDDIRKILGSDTNSFASLLTSPVKFERHAIYPVKNMGASMTPFYTAMAIWVGALLMVALMETSLSKKRLKKMEKIRPVKNWQIYLGRYVIFATISLAQTTLMCLGSLFFLEVQCVHPWLFMLTGWALALAFSFLIYTLSISFGNIGKALAVILLVLQIAASGGTFPFAMINDSFKIFYPYLPLTYATDAFRCCIAGFSGVEYLVKLGLATLPLIPISLLLGLILRNPIIKLNEYVTKQVEKTKVM